MLLEGYLEFENTIPVTKECLGKHYSINIAGIEGFLLMPLIFEGFDEEGKLGPLRQPIQGKVVYSDSFDWGSVHAWPVGDSSIRACKIIFDGINASLFEEIRNKIALDLPRWRSLLIDNISLILERDYRGARRAITSKSYGIGEFGLFQNIEGQRKRFIPTGYKNPVIKIFVGSELGFDPEGLQKVLTDTSNGKMPLLPFYYLFEAERAIFEENFRKSILDSATSVEVCFSFLINHLLPYNDELNKYVSSKHNSLRLKRELLETLKIQLPKNGNDYIMKLDSVRNRVIHAGHAPNRAEANAAYEIAKQTLYVLLPNMYEL